MKTIKPFRLGVMTRCFEEPPKCYFVVTVLALFPFDDTSTLLTDVELWKLVAEKLGKRTVFDEGWLKLNGEAFVWGDAYPPGGKPHRACAVSLKLGSIDKTLYVVGDRHWRADGPSKPEPFVRMPVSYENAFGGEGFAQNPLGKGYKSIATLDGTVHPLPNIEHEHHLIKSVHDRPAPASFGPLDVSWPQRSTKLGTYDQAWLDKRFPGFAADLEGSFFNAAPQDQQIKGYFEGTEAFVIEHMHPEKPQLQGQLPGIVARAFFTQKTRDGEIFHEVNMHAETVHLFPNVERGALVFRGIAEVAEDDAADVLHLLVACDRLGEARPRSHYQHVLAQRLVKKKGALLTLRESDLVPPDMVPEGQEFPLKGTAGRVDKEGLLKQNLQRQAEKKLAEARQQVADFGLDPDKYLPESLPEPEPPPTLSQLPEYVEEKQQLLKEKKAETEQNREQALAKARAECEKYGVDFDAIVAANQGQGGGPPTFSAVAEMDKLRDQVQLAQNVGVELPMVNEKLADPQLLEKLQAAEGQLREAYRRFAHYQPAAQGLGADVAASLGEQLRRAVAVGEAVQHRDFTGADLSGANLSGADLSGVWLEVANLANANLQGANLAGAVLTRADLTGINLAKADLVGANLGAATLCGADLGAANLTRAVLNKANLSGVNLKGADLSKADLMEARLEQADLSHIKGVRLRFLYTDLAGLKMVGADLTKAVFVEPNVEGVDFSGANLTSAAFVTARGRKAVFCNAVADNLRVVKDSNFADTDFRGASLEKANFRGTNLYKADFSGAKLRKADLSETNLRHARFYRAEAPGALFMKADLDRADLTGINLKDGLLSKAVITGADFKGANLFRADFTKIHGDKGTNFDRANMDFIRFVQRSTP